MVGTFKLGRILGFQINVHWSWLFIFVLVTLSFAEGFKDPYPGWADSRRWVVGAAVAMIFFLSILLHEMSHSVLARRYGIPVSGITLFVFGGVSSLEREPDNARQEFWIALVGPLMSVFLALMFLIAYVALRPLDEGASDVSLTLAIINLAIGIFNLVPGFPLDGGRVLRSVYWARNRNILDATRIASNAGRLVGFLIMAIGLVSLAFGFWIQGLWFLLIGNFLRNASTTSYEQLFMDTVLKGVPVSAVARQDYVAVAPDLTIAGLVDEHVLNGQGRCFPVMAGEELLGLVTMTDLRNFPRDQWPETTVYRAMTPLSKLRTVGPGDDLPRVLAQMATGDINQVPLVEGRFLRGMIHRSDVLHYIQVRQEIGTGVSTE